MLSVPVRPANDIEPCPCCGGRSPLFGVVDFNKSCLDTAVPILALSGTPVYYNRCEACGYVFSRAFDHWNRATFALHIYNQDYGVVDPEFADVRPDRLANDIIRLFGAYREQISILDWGGGDGKAAAKLTEHGFDATCFDPFFSETSELPKQQFDLIVAIEVIEHLVDPLVLPQAALTLLKPEGVVVMSTCIQPPEFARERMNWWYLAPRNGHIGLHSEKSLRLIWQDHGFQFGSSEDKIIHMAYRNLPEFARPLIRL